MKKPKKPKPRNPIARVSSKMPTKVKPDKKRDYVPKITYNNGDNT